MENEKIGYDNIEFDLTIKDNDSTRVEQLYMILITIQLEQYSV